MNYAEIVAWMRGLMVGEGLVIMSLLGVIYAILRSQLDGVRASVDQCVKQPQFDNMADRLETMGAEMVRIETEAREGLQSVLVRIENKIDANEARSAGTRHSMRDDLHALKLKIEVAIARGVLGRVDPAP